jgi:7,8-dihydropterin-6-yl-methyl-4-(beta-D-ribofuranosyl)aminobenzene 5'-phosphate synthase
MKKWLKRLSLGALLGFVLFLGITLLRLGMAKLEIQRQSAAGVPSKIETGTTNTLQIIPLYEKATTQEDVQTGLGVSYLVRTDSATVLFDLGNNPETASPSPLEQNMVRLGVSLSDVDIIVFSHRHPDHVGGMEWWNQGTFSLDGLTQPALEVPIYIPEAMTYPGSQPVLASLPTRLVEGIATTGIITYSQPFPIWLATPTGDEQSLAVNVAGEGIVLITGCGHMGLELLLQRAQAAFDVPVIGIVGGLHYGNQSAADLTGEVDLLRTIQPTLVALSPHDSAPAAIDAFRQAFGSAYQDIAIGREITFPPGVAVR